ncbi:MAG TPA: helix-turn-helix transcriptional regulator [Hanamia sp.]|nr:helix-turn-helix transcriptional regulator [Hanamia sp.]
MKKNDIKKGNKDWSKKLKFRVKNQKWLDYSAKIAMRIDAVIEDKINFNQLSLAETLKVSPQQVSKILKGEQNLTLKTIGNLSDALGFELISFPPYKDSYIRLMQFEIGDYSNNNEIVFKSSSNEINKNLNANQTKETSQKDECIVISMNMDGRTNSKEIAS